jgi:hypothetical protein
MSEQARIDSTVRLWLDWLRERNRPVSGDMRVSEFDATALLGMAPNTLKNKRTEGDAPRAYRLGIGGSRVSYRLHDLAAWVEARRESY